MLLEGTLNKLETTRQFFENSLDGVEESDGSFSPKEGMFTLAQHVAHVAQTIDWFLEGMFSDAFDLDFEAHEQKVKEINSFNEAKAWFDQAFEQAKAKLQSAGEEALKERLPAGPIMGGVPRYIVVGAISDHCAHHRGAIAVYIRMLGKEPRMPYE